MRKPPSLSIAFAQYQSSLSIRNSVSKTTQRSSIAMIKRRAYHRDMKNGEAVPHGWKENPSRVAHRARLASFAALFSAVMFAFPTAVFGSPLLMRIGGALFLISAIALLPGRRHRYASAPYLVFASFTFGALASMVVAFLVFNFLVTDPTLVSVESVCAIFAVSLWIGSVSEEFLASAQYLRNQFDNAHPAIQTFFGFRTKKRLTDPIKLDDLAGRSRSRGWWR
jgi:hypothetical protein